MYRLFLFMLIFYFLLPGCEKTGSPMGQMGDTKQQVKYQGKKASPGMIQSVSYKADLRARLPANTIAYARIPGVWSFLSTPKGNMLSQALADSNHIELVTKLRESLYQQLFKTDNSKAGHQMSAAFYHVRAPVEIAVFSKAAALNNDATQNATGKLANAAIPYVMLYTRLGFKDVNSFKQFFSALLLRSGIVKIISETNANGEGVLQDGNLKMFYRFNPANGEFYIVSSESINKTDADAVYSSLTQASHPMHELEKQIDESGLGYFFWVDSRLAYNTFAQYFNTLSAGQAMRMSMVFGMTKYIAGGWGVSNKKGRLKFLVKVTHMDLSSYVDTLGTSFDIKTAGEPQFLAALALPGPKQWQSTNPFIKGPPGSYREKRFDANMLKMKNTIGFDVTELLNAIGPKVLVYSDKAGEFLAVQMRDRKKFRELIASAAKIANLNYQTFKMSGLDVNYLQIPLQSSKGMGKNIPLFVQALLKRRIHLYWTEQGDYAVFGGVPQMLSDQHQYSQKVNIGNWLANIQRQKTENSFLLLSTRVKSTPRGMYYIYLQTLQMLGDLVDQPVDLSKLPSAFALNLPVKGSYGLKLDINQDLLGFELLFENNPLEFLVNMDVTTIAVAGILAAVAVPAYNDYKVRAEVNMGIYKAASFKQALVNYYKKHKKFPDLLTLQKAPEFKSLQTTFGTDDKQLNSIVIMTNTGKVMIRYTGSSLRGASLQFSPVVENDVIVRWQCESTLSYKYTPVICR